MAIRNDAVTQSAERAMTIINRESGTNVYEVTDDIYRISTPVKIAGEAGFSFSQYLIVDRLVLLGRDSKT